MNIATTAPFIPATMSPKAFSREECSAYNRDGFIIVRGLVQQNDLDDLRSVYKRAQRFAAEHDKSFIHKDAHFDLEITKTGPRIRKVQEIFHIDKDYSRIFGSDKILNYVADLIGDNIFYHSSKLMCKPALGGRRKPWHQDWAYWTDMCTRQVTLWVAINPATKENGCVQVWPGSHLQGLYPHKHREDFMIEESQVPESEIIFAELKPGDAIFFSVLTLHGSDTNNSIHDRLSAIMDYDSQSHSRHIYGSEKPLR